MKAAAPSNTLIHGTAHWNPSTRDAAITVGTVATTSATPASIDEVPVEVIDYVGGQVDVGFESLFGYDWTGSSWERHRRQIRARFGFRAWSLDDVEPAIDGLIVECLQGGGSRRQAIDALAGWCRRSCVEPPFPAAADRLVGSTIRRWEGRIADQIVYINTLMIQDILDDDTTPVVLDDTDRRALTPLTYSHINPYGEFTLDLDTHLALT